MDYIDKHLDCFKLKKIKGDALAMKKLDVVIIKDKGKIKTTENQDLIKCQLEEKMLLEDFGEDNIIFLE